MYLLPRELSFLKQHASEFNRFKLNSLV